MDQDHVAIEDIWDAPVEPRSPRVPLFLHGSDDENDPDRMLNAPPRRASDPEPDVDAMFSGVANMPDESGDNAEHRASTPHSTPHPILSSSPAHHIDGEDGGEKDKDGKKPKKKIMRLDEGRLIGENGFPQLIQDTKSIKIKGKGHEASDLNRILNVYQFWTHRLYPKTPFKDTVDRVEKLCHSKRMHNMLGVWRDEAHGVVTGKQHEADEDDSAVIDLTANPSVPGPDSDQADYASSSSHAATRPPSSGEDCDDFDSVAMDANARVNAQQTDSDATASRGATEDDNAARQELHAESAPSVASQADQEEDEEMWALVDEVTAAAAVRTTAPTRKAVVSDKTSDEEEGWHLVDELARVASVPQSKGMSSPQKDVEESTLRMDEPSSGAPMGAPQQKDLPSVEEDSADMYI
ncbi:replication fork protection component Swi3-domain-containing protein [Mycena belliarum]|uniref:Chromosome segregation in meiosis protein n=1 Tax=Mycena belliarum TaxID=1033014 RepID=A0AAD6XYS8_9AGAR|nr:replication fork protection component Swi3-domain-containing protein [Mycena belliae]